jgi:hypothetical protein
MKAPGFLSAVFALLLVSGPSNAETVSLRSLVAKKAAVIRNMHDKATRAIVQVAQDPAFLDYFEAAHAKDAHGETEAKTRIDHISLAAQKKFHVEEMCLIDATGTEISRIVQNQIAYDLSPAEADNAFFAPSFQRKPRTTYIAPLYISADVAKWVIAYTTPIEFAGRSAAILHYEHGLDVYQAALNKEPVAPDTYIVAVDSGGFVVSDSRKAIPTAKRDDETDPAIYFERFSLEGRSVGDIQALLKDKVDRALTFEGLTYNVALEKVADWMIVGVQQAP